MILACSHLVLAGLLAAEMSVPPSLNEEVRSLDPEAALREVFADPAFEFCHDRHYPLSNREYRWCSQISQSSACPEFEALCARGATAVEREGPQELPTFELPNLSGFLQIALWSALAALCGLLVWLIVRNLLRFKQTNAPIPLVTVPAAAVAAKPEAFLETDVQKLLERARVAASSADMTAAVMFAHAALLRRLEGDGIVKVHPSRTTSEYLHDVGRTAPLHQQAVADILHAVDRAQFAASKPDLPLVEALLTRVVNLNLKMPTIASILLIAFVGVVSAGCDETSRSDWEQSPSGVEAVVRYLQKTGLDARERLAPISSLDADTGQLVLLPNVTLSEEDWKHVDAWQAAGGRLILAPGPLHLPPWLPVKFEGTRSTQESLRKLVGGDVPQASPLQLGPGYAQWSDLRVLAPIEQILKTEQEAVPLLTLKNQMYAAALQLEEGEVVVFADRNLFSNAALLVGDNARFLRNLLDGHPGRIEIAGDLAGRVSPNPVASVGRGKLAPFMFQVMLFVAGLFGMRGIFFGNPLHAPATSRRRFAEHIRALGLQLRRARAARHALSTLGNYLIDRLRRRARQTGQQGVGALAESLARQTGRPVGDIARYLIMAREDTPLQRRRGRGHNDEAQEQADAVCALAALLPFADNPLRRRPSSRGIADRKPVPAARDDAGLKELRRTP